MAQQRYFEAHSTTRQEALAGLPLAFFWQRLLGYFLDLVIAVTLWAPSEYVWRKYILHEHDFRLVWDFHEKGNLIAMLIYYGLANYFGNGQTIGKWIARTRAVSLKHHRLTLWQSIERALGYGAAILEGGLGFLQFFWDRNRQCAQDRLAETIVVDVRKSARREQRPEANSHAIP